MGNMNNWEGILKHLEGSIVIKQVKGLKACNWGAAKTNYIELIIVVMGNARNQGIKSTRKKRPQEVIEEQKEKKRIESEDFFGN